MLSHTPFTQGKEMVEGVSAGAAKKLLLSLPKVSHEIAHLRIIVQVIRLQSRLDLSLLDHFHRVFASTGGRYEVHSYFRRGRSKAFFGNIGLRHIPIDLAGFDAKLVLQDASEPNRRRGIVAMHRDAPAAELRRMMHRRVCPTIHAAQTKTAREEDRQCSKRDASQPGQDEGRNRKLAAINFPCDDRTVTRADIVQAFAEAGLKIEIDTPDPNRAIEQCLGIG